MLHMIDWRVEITVQMQSRPIYTSHRQFVETNELLYICQTIWSELGADCTASMLICLKYGEIIRCVIFPDSSEPTRERST